MPIEKSQDWIFASFCETSLDFLRNQAQLSIYFAFSSLFFLAFWRAFFSPIFVSRFVCKEEIGEKKMATEWKKENSASLKGKRWKKNNDSGSGLEGLAGWLQGLYKALTSSDDSFATGECVLHFNIQRKSQMSDLGKKTGTVKKWSVFALCAVKVLS